VGRGAPWGKKRKEGERSGKGRRDICAKRGDAVYPVKRRRGGGPSRQRMGPFPDELHYSGPEKGKSTHRGRGGVKEKTSVPNAKERGKKDFNGTS